MLQVIVLFDLSLAFLAAFGALGLLGLDAALDFSAFVDHLFEDFFVVAALDHGEDVFGAFGGLGRWGGGFWGFVGEVGGEGEVAGRRGLGSVRGREGVGRG